MIEKQAKWMLCFNLPDGSRHEPGFPEYDFWKPNKETSIAEGRRVLMELRRRGDQRDWLAHGHIGPWEYQYSTDADCSWYLLLSSLPDASESD